MKYYILTVRTLYRNMPNSVYTDDHLVYNDLDILNQTVEKLQTFSCLQMVKIEEGAFKNGKLVGKKVLRDFLKEDE